MNKVVFVITFKGSFNLDLYFNRELKGRIECESLAQAKELKKRMLDRAKEIK